MQGGKGPCGKISKVQTGRVAKHSYQAKVATYMFGRTPEGHN